MVVGNSSDIFQDKMNDLFQGFESIHIYMDKRLFLTQGDWKNYLKNMDITLNN